MSAPDPHHHAVAQPLHDRQSVRRQVPPPGFPRRGLPAAHGDRRKRSGPTSRDRRFPTPLRRIVSSASRRRFEHLPLQVIGRAFRACDPVPVDRGAKEHGRVARRRPGPAPAGDLRPRCRQARGACHVEKPPPKGGGSTSPLARHARPSRRPATCARRRQTRRQRRAADAARPPESRQGAGSRPVPAPADLAEVDRSRAADDRAPRQARESRPPCRHAAHATRRTGRPSRSHSLSGARSKKRCAKRADRPVAGLGRRIDLGKRLDIGGRCRDAHADAGRFASTLAVFDGARSAPWCAPQRRGAREPQRLAGGAVLPEKQGRTCPRPGPPLPDTGPSRSGYLPQSL